MLKCLMCETGFLGHHEEFCSEDCRDLHKMYADDPNQKIHTYRCACGCGEIVQRYKTQISNPERVYLNRSHLIEHSSSGGRGKQFTYVCACGCGASVQRYISQVKNPDAVYVNNQHRAHHASRRVSGRRDLTGPKKLWTGMMKTLSSISRELHHRHEPEPMSTANLLALYKHTVLDW